MISYTEASNLIREEISKINLEAEFVDLSDSFHRTLAEDIISDVNLPPFDNSAVDGIAVLYSNETKEWKLIGEISAGNYKDIQLSKNEAVKIMTGARIPEDVSSIIPVEDLLFEGSNARLIEDAKFHIGMNIRKKGSDIKEGEIAVERGTFLEPRHLSAAASCGKDKLKVYKKLKFAILSTGDELINVNEKPVNDKIRVSNIYSLYGEVLEINQAPINYGFINDDKSKIKNLISEILKSGIDILLTTGGVSVGEYDFLKTIFNELGVKEIFWQAYIKPGKPMYFGSFDSLGKKKLIFGLPGNPVSSHVNFIVYIKENVKKLFGIKPNETIKAELTNDLKKKDKKRHFMKGFLERRGENYFVSSVLSQSSGNLVELSKSNCLIEIEEDYLNPEKGEMVNCIPM
ncbi:MAG: molybdopterin molybdotransferase MoeA [Ignavibacteriaceae bacterium]